MEKINRIRQAVVLAGGAGTRLQPFTLRNPKPMVPVNTRPFLEHLIDLLKENGIREVILLIGYKGEKIVEHFGNGRKFGLRIRYSYSPFKDYFGEEIKSGLRILNAHELLEEQFLLMYCDNYWPLELGNLEQFFNARKGEVLVSVYSNWDKSTRSNVFVSEDGLIIKYDKSRVEQNLNGVDIGFMIVRKRVLSLLPKANSKFEDEVFPKLIKERRLLGFLSDQKYYSIGDTDRVKKTAKFLKDKKVIFLDRDGVINNKAPKSDYIKSWDEFKFIDGSIEAMKFLTEKKYQIFIVSNQAGVARGIMSQNDLSLITKKMVSVLRKQGIRISGVYYCTHGWDEGCFCRKPKPGMFYRASREHFVNLSKSLFIGDETTDKLAGDAAGVKTLIVSKKTPLIKIVYSLS